MDIFFGKKRYKLVVTDHARMRIKSRDLTDEIVVDIIQTGTVKPKSVENRYWIYKDISNRHDKAVCLSVAIEEPNLIIITALINWRPES